MDIKKMGYFIVTVGDYYYSHQMESDHSLILSKEFSEARKMATVSEANRLANLIDGTVIKFDAKVLRVVAKDERISK